MKRERKRTKSIIIVVILFTLIIPIALFGLRFTASSKREWKSFTSNLAGGLNRTVSLYDEHGNLIRTWEGLIDITDSTTEICFDLDGKRTVIHGGIVVVQEN